MREGGSIHYITKHALGWSSEICNCLPYIHPIERFAKRALPRVKVGPSPSLCPRNVCFRLLETCDQLKFANRTPPSYLVSSLVW